MRPQRNRRTEHDDRGRERHPAPEADAPLAEQQHEQAARDGQPGQKRKQAKPHVISFLLLQVRVRNQPSITARPMTIQKA